MHTCTGWFKKVWCSKLTIFLKIKQIILNRMVLYNNALFWDIDTTFIYTCVKFQPHTSKVPLVIEVKGMMGQTGLGW